MESNILAFLGFSSICFAIINIFKLLRGNSFNSILVIILVRLFLFSTILFSCQWFLGNYATVVICAYSFFYLDCTEHYFRHDAFVYWRFDFIAEMFRHYFSVRLIKTCDINSQCIFGLHPHGILPFGAVINFASDKDFPKLFPNSAKRVLLTASGTFTLPLFREYIIANKMRDCSRFNFMKWLENGYNVGIIPGGSREALYADPDYDCLDLRRKRGFVRLAIMYGVDLVPVFTFNENDQYEQVRYTNMPTILNDIRQLLIQNTTGICLPFLFHLLPRKGTILTTVVGEPIKVTSNPSPTEEEVSKLMDLYISKLEELYNKHGPIYNSKPKKLIIL